MLLLNLVVWLIFINLLRGKYPLACWNRSDLECQPTVNRVVLRGIFEVRRCAGSAHIVLYSDTMRSVTTV